mgnify:CR=1 FL=1
MVPSNFWLVPKNIHKPVLQNLCKLDPAEAALISIISQKYSLVRKGPSIISILLSTAPINVVFSLSRFSLKCLHSTILLLS